MANKQRRTIKRAVPFTAEEEAEHKKWAEVAETIRQHKEVSGASFRELQKTLFDIPIGVSDLHSYLSHPDTLYQARPRTKEAFKGAAKKLKSTTCKTCSFYDNFDSRISRATRRSEFSNLIGDYKLFRYADNGKSVAEYSATMFACPDCERPRMRWLADQARHRTIPAERYGFVFILSNRIHIIGADVDRVLMLYLRRSDQLEAPLTGIMLNMHKDHEVPIATKIVLCRTDALLQLSDHIEELLQNESDNPNILVGWRNRPRPC